MPNALGEGKCLYIWKICSRGARFALSMVAPLSGAKAEFLTTPVFKTRQGMKEMSMAGQRDPLMLKSAMASATALRSLDDIESFMVEYYAAWGGTDEDRIMS